MRALAGVEFIGEDRADIGRQRAALGVMSKLVTIPAGYDANWLLPNPPPKKQQTLEDMYQALFSYKQRTQWPPNPSEP